MFPQVADERCAQSYQLFGSALECRRAADPGTGGAKPIPRRPGGGALADRSPVIDPSASLVLLQISEVWKAASQAAVVPTVPASSSAGGDHDLSLRLVVSDRVDPKQR